MFKPIKYCNLVILSGGRDIISHIKHKQTQISETSNCKEDSSKEAEKKVGDWKRKRRKRKKKKGKDRLEMNNNNEKANKPETKPDEYSQRLTNPWFLNPIS